MSKHYKNVCPKCSGVDQCRGFGEKTETHEIYNDCKESLSEDAAAGSVGATSVAGVRGVLFTGIREITQKRKKVAGVPVVKFKNPEVDLNFRTRSIGEGRTTFRDFLIKESGVPDAEFDTADIISKLSQNAKIVGDLDGDDVAVFGMEGDDGSVTKVYVQKQQAKDFEIALGEILKDNPEANQEEIAGILFDLKDRFKIIDVKWPTIQEDEEQQVDSSADLTPNNQSAPSTEEDPFGGDAGVLPNVNNDTTPAAGSGTSDSNTNDMITQILDMLRADAEARKADADAKTADAHAREAESTAKITTIKMQGEEEVLDAEAYFREKKEEKKEAERLKMLARFRQENKMSQQDTDEQDPAPSEVTKKDPSEEDEERVTMTRKSLLSLLQKVQ
jgi:hypothetical protein